MCDGQSSILVVEDDDEIRTCLQQVLELEGFHVEAAANGREALDRLASTERPCVILLDLLMPVMNGLEFMQAMGTNRETADIPVVVVSAYADLAARAPAAAWLEKPAELDEILDVVHRFCHPTTETGP